MGDLIQLFGEKPEADPNDPVALFWKYDAEITAALHRLWPERYSHLPTPSSISETVTPISKPAGRKRRQKEDPNQ